MEVASVPEVRPVPVRVPLPAKPSLAIPDKKLVGVASSVPRNMYKTSLDPAKSNPGSDSETDPKFTVGELVALRTVIMVPAEMVFPVLLVHVIAPSADLEGEDWVDCSSCYR